MLPAYFQKEFMSENPKRQLNNNLKKHTTIKTD